MVREYQCNNMVMELVREISRVDTKELARDSSGTRSYSLFLVELAERCVVRVEQWYLPYRAYRGRYQ